MSIAVFHKSPISTLLQIVIEGLDTESFNMFLLLSDALYLCRREDGIQIGNYCYKTISKRELKFHVRNMLATKAHNILYDFPHTLDVHFARSGTLFPRADISDLKMRWANRFADELKAKQQKHI